MKVVSRPPGDWCARADYIAAQDCRTGTTGRVSVVSVGYRRRCRPAVGNRRRCRPAVGNRRRCRPAVGNLPVLKLAIPLEMVQEAWFFTALLLCERGAVLLLF